MSELSFTDKTMYTRKGGGEIRDPKKQFVELSFTHKTMYTWGIYKEFGEEEKNLNSKKNYQPGKITFFKIIYVRKTDAVHACAV